MASECCLTSYLAVARGEAPRRHWFQLGRPFIRAAGRIGLISWGGTMFEYLMPRLMLRSLPGTLLAEACRTAVARQIEYGQQLGLPWGISESGFAAQYLDGDYQYQAFGVPGLGLKQGLEQDRVVAPYATAMATMLAPREALENFRRLIQEGPRGNTASTRRSTTRPTACPRGSGSVVVRSYMAHHQGMSLVALTNALLADVMTRRFQAEPMVRAIDLLLQERVPSDAPIVETDATRRRRSSRLAPADGARRHGRPDEPAADDPGHARPAHPILSNPQYHVLLTNAGSGFSTCRGLDVTRWREDAPARLGPVLLHARRAARAGLVGRLPAGLPASRGYEVIFAADKATFRRRDHGIETLLEVIVSPEHRVEIRRITLVNHDSRPRELELTSYAEIVLAPHGADLGHPAFAKLFLETEWLPRPGAILCRRRMRSAHEQPVWADARRGRGRSTAAGSGGRRGPVRDRPCSVPRPRADAGEPGRAGPGRGPLGHHRPGARPDLLPAPPAPARAGRDRPWWRWPPRSPSRATRPWPWPTSSARPAPPRAPSSWPGRTARSSTGTAIAPARMRTCSSGWRRTSSSPAGPCGPTGDNRRQPSGPAGLWRFGISGDRPIVLARIAGTDQLPLARQLLAAHAYLRAPGLEFDLVLLDEEPGSYLDELNRQLLSRVRAAGGAERVDQPGGVFVLKASQMSEDERIVAPGGRAGRAGRRAGLAGQPARPDRVAPPAARPVWPCRASASNGTTSRSAARLTCSSPTAWAASRPTAASTVCSSRARPLREPPATVAAALARAFIRGSSCPVGQRRRQPAFRFRRLRGGLGVHLGRQQPVQPPDPLEQRPGLRPARRGRLPPRRGDRRGLVPDAVAGPLG